MNEETQPKSATVLARDTMVGQICDLVLDHMKHERKRSVLSWDMWPEGEQQALNERVRRSVIEVVDQAVEIIHSDRRPAILLDIQQMVVQNGIKIVAKAARTEGNLVVLGNLVGEAALLIVPNAARYHGGQEFRPESLQIDLDLADDYGEAA